MCLLKMRNSAQHVYGKGAVHTVYWATIPNDRLLFTGQCTGQPTTGTPGVLLPATASTVTQLRCMKEKGYVEKDSVLANREWPMLLVRAPLHHLLQSTLMSRIKP